MPVTMVECNSEGERVLHAREVILSSEGRWFEADFIKRTDGTERHGTFRTGVKKYVKGVGLSYNPKAHDLLGVWEAGNKAGDKEADAYRMVNLRGVYRLKVDGVEYIYTPKPLPLAA
jgi:hypothetical protein